MQSPVNLVGARYDVLHEFRVCHHHGITLPFGYGVIEFVDGIKNSLTRLPQRQKRHVGPMHRTVRLVERWRGEFLIRLVRSLNGNATFCFGNLNLFVGAANRLLVSCQPFEFFSVDGHLLKVLPLVTVLGAQQLDIDGTLEC